MNLLPPWQEEESPDFSTPYSRGLEQKAKSHIVNPTLFNEGRTQYHIDRARNLQAAAPALEQQQPEPTSISEAYHQVGMDLSNPEVQKDAPWWQKATSKLGVLGYLAIPEELITQAVEGIIPGKWEGMEGTAPREDFESWKVLFGEDSGSFKERMDSIVESNEKRPLWAQIGLGLAAGAASFGLGTYAKAAAIGGRGTAKLTASLARGAGYAVDPAELGIQAVGQSIKKTKAFVTTVRSGKPIIIPDGRSLNVQGGSSSIDDYYNLERRRHIEENFHEVSLDTRLEHLFPYNSAEGRNAPRFGVIGQEGAYLKLEKSNKDVPWADMNHPTNLSPIAHRGNEFRRLFGDLAKRQREAIGTPVNSEILEEARDLALLVVQLGMASRPGAITKQTVGELRKFLKTQRIDLGAQDGGRSGSQYSLDSLESLSAVENYLARLDEWAKLHNTVIDDSSFAFSARMDKDTLKFKEFGLNTKVETQNTFFSSLHKGIVDKYRNGLGPHGTYEITENARAIRNQRASEMWLSGVPFEDIQYHLGHTNPLDTRGYIHDIDVHIGMPQDPAPSRFLSQLMQGNAILQSVQAAGEDVLERIGKNIEDISMALNKAAAAGLKNSRAKGKTTGGAIRVDLVANIGEAFMRSPELRKFNTIFWKKIDALKDEAIKKNDAPLAIAEEMVAVAAISRIARNMGQGYKTIKAKHDGISAGNWKPKGTKRTVTHWGKLQRAGFTLKGNDIVPPTDPRALADRAEYAAETGLIRELGDGLDFASANKWNKWAKGLAEERKALRKVLDEYGHLYDTKGIKRAWLKHEALDEYVLGKMYHLQSQWDELDRAGLIDGDLKWVNDLSQDILAANASYNIVDNAAASSGYYAARREALNKLESSSLLDLYNWTPIGAQKFREVGNGIQISTKPIMFAGRKIVMAIMPDGTKQPFYFRTGGGGPLHGEYRISQIEKNNIFAQVDAFDTQVQELMRRDDVATSLNGADPLFDNPIYAKEIPDIFDAINDGGLPNLTNKQKAIWKRYKAAIEKGPTKTLLKRFSKKASQQEIENLFRIRRDQANIIKDIEDRVYIKGEERWVPFDGFAEMENWFHKAKYTSDLEAKDPLNEWYRYGVGNTEIRNVARHLDSIKDEIPEPIQVKSGSEINEFLERERVVVRPYDFFSDVWKDVSKQGEDVVGGYAAASYKFKNLHIQKWLESENTRKALQILKLSRDSSPENIRKKIYTLATTKPEMFGPNFAKTANNNKEVATDFLDDIIRKMVLNREVWLENYEQLNVRAFLDEADKEKVMGQLRIALGDPNEVLPFFGERVTDIVKSPTLVNTVPKVKSNEHFQRIAALPYIGKHVFMPLISAAMGGRALVGRNIIKPLSARGFMYTRHEGDAKHLGNFIRAIMEDKQDGLGMVTIAPTKEMIAAGITEGNQYFSKLVLRPLEEIRAFENLQTTKDKYIAMGRLADKRRADGFLPAYEKIKGITGMGENAYKEAALVGEDLSNPANMLRQADVVLERILPEHWDKYFANLKTADGKYTQQWHALRYIKETQNQIDLLAKERGVDIVQRIRANEGEYLANYFPRLYRQGNQRYRLGAPQREIGSLSKNSFVSQFMPRQQADIFDQLANSINTAGKTTDEIEKSVLESANDRIAIYYEAMMKEGTDMETKEYILGMSDYRGGKYSKSIAEWKKKDDELDNLQRLVNDKVAGKVVGDEKWNIRADRLLRSDFINKYKWIASDDPATVGRARQAQDEILKYIDSERVKLGYDREIIGAQQVLSDDWMRAMWKQLPIADQHAAREQLEMSAPGILSAATATGKALYPVTNILRTFKAGLDVGAPFIHGFNALVRLPMLDGKFDLASQKAWFKGVKEMYRFVWNPDNLDNYMVDNYALRQEAGQWIKLGHAEPLAASLGESGFMQNVKKSASRAWVKGTGGKVQVQGKADPRLLDRFESGFVGYTDVLRMELYKAFKPSVDRTLKMQHKGIDINDINNPIVRNAYHEMGAVINKMTGVFDQELAGMTPLQRIMESSLLFFAPMYRRATYGIIADIFRNSSGGATYKIGTSIRSREALKQLTGVVGVGAMIASLVDMTGNNPEGTGDIENFIKDGGDPNLNHKFGKMNIMGAQTGIGTAWWTAFRLASDLAMMSYGEDKNLDDENLDWLQDNPVLALLGRKGRSQLAPGAGQLVDIIQGRTFVGDPLRDPDGSMDWDNTLQNLGGAALPFWLDGALEGSWRSGTAPIMMTAEALGFTSYEMSEFDKLQHAREFHILTSELPKVKTWRDNLKEGEELNWVSAPDLVQEEIDDKIPDVAVLKAKFEERAEIFAKGNSAEYREFMQQKKSFTENTMKQISSATLRWEKMEIDGRTLSNLISKARYNRVQSNKALLASYPGLEQWLDELRAGKSDKDKLFWGDILHDAYQAEVVFHPGNENEDGSYNYEHREQLHMQFLQDYSLESDGKEMKYIKEASTKWMNANPIMKAFNEDRETLRAYWQIHDYLWKPGTKGARLAMYYTKATTKQQKSLRDNIPAFAEIHKKIRDARLRLRDENPWYDWLLVKWGYVTVARHSSVQQHLERYEAERMQARAEHLQNPNSWPFQSPHQQSIEVNISGRIEVNDENRIAWLQQQQLTPVQ